MKVDNRFHCFGCQADGDVISFTARLFNLSPKDAAVKLAADFGINYDTHSPPKHIVPKVNKAERHKQQTDCCFRELADYRHRLVQWKDQYAPMSMQEEVCEELSEWKDMDTRMGVVLKVTGEAIGRAGYWVDDNGDDSVDYDFNLEFLRKGYAVEAVKEFIAHLVRDLHVKEIFGDCDERNSASAKL